MKIRLSRPDEAWLSLAINFPGRVERLRRLFGGGCSGYVLGGCLDYLKIKLRESIGTLAELFKINNKNIFD